MADETPQQAPAQAGGGASGGEQTPASKPSGGLGSYLPLVIILVLMPALAWVTMEFKSRMDKKRAGSPAPEEEHAESAKTEKKEAAKPESSHGAAKDEKGKKNGKKGKRDTKIPIPLTRDAVAYHVKDDAKEGDFDKIVVLDLKGEPREEAKSDKIVVNIANTGGSRFAVARLSMVGEHGDLVERINQNRERLLDRASGLLSSHTPEDIEKPGFRNILRSELLAEFNEILGRGTIQEVLITEFIIQ